MQHGHMSDSDVFSDGHRITGIGVKDGTILNIAVFTDGDPVIVGTDNDIEPDGCIGFNDDISDNCGIVRNESGGMNFRCTVS